MSKNAQPNDNTDYYHPVGMSSNPPSASDSAAKSAKGDSEETRPLHPEGLQGSDDVESGPAPPYSERDPSYLRYSPFKLPKWQEWQDQSPEKKKKTRKVILHVLGIGLAVVLLMNLFRSSNDGVSWHSGGSGGSGPGWSGKHGQPVHDHGDSDPSNFPEDGQAVNCAVFDSSTVWTRFPNHPHQPHLPSPIRFADGRSYERLSTNVSFDVPVRDDVFAHLHGPSGVGSVFVTTQTSSGDHAEVVVETIVDVATGENVADSIGYEYLEASNVCRMAKDSHKRSDDDDVRDGVGIYTARPDHDHGNHGDSHLQFRVYVSLPAGTNKEDLPSLHIINPVGSVYLADISDSPLDELNLDVSVGSIHAEKARAEEIEIATSGSVRGTYQITEKLDIEVSTGSINVDVDLVEAKDEAGPYKVHLHSDSGEIQLRYGKWEDASRALRQDISTDVGSIQLHPHPVYEGPYTFSTSVGSIHVDIPRDTTDPLGKGREREISLNKKDGVVSKYWTGVVEWIKKGGKDASGSKHDQAYMDAKTSTGSIHVTF